MTLAMVDSSSGAASACGDEGGDDVGRRRQHQHAAHHGADRVQPELEPGRDAEVAAAATDRPEQVRVRLGVHVQELPSAVTTSAASRSSIVRPYLRTRYPMPPPSVMPADPDRAGVAEPGRQAVGAGRGRVLPGGQARLGPRGAPVDVDVQRAHVREVEHDPPLGRVAGAAVAAAADGELQPGLAGELTTRATSRRRRRAR